MLIRGVFVLAILFAVIFPAAAEIPEPIPGNYRIGSWAAADGLPPDIRAIAQDSEGYLWLGSAAGLIRFDGVQFKAWEELGMPPLLDRGVQSLYTARDGSLWVGFGPTGGVSRIQAGRVRTYTLAEGVPAGSIRAMVEDSAGAFWAGGFGGLSRFRNGRWEKMGSADGLIDVTTVVSLLEDQRGNLFVATAKGVFCKASGTNSFARVASLVDGVQDLVEDSAGTIWASAPQWAFGKLDLLAPTRSPPLGWERFNGFRLLRDTQNGLWVGTLGQGLLHVRDQDWTNGRKVERITRHDGLVGDFVTSIFEDRDGAVWVGTDAGLTRLWGRDQDPIAMLPQFTGRVVTTVIGAKDGSLWTGTADGVNRLSGASSQWYGAGLHVTAVHEDPRGSVFVASQLGVFQFVSGVSHELRPLSGARLDQVAAIVDDPEGGLWLCDFTGVYHWSNGSLVKQEPITGARGSPSSALTDRQGRVWIGFSGGGLVVYRDGGFHPWHLEEVGDHAISAIYEDRRGAIWIGSQRGLSRFENGATSTFTREEGLPDNNITTIVEDSDGLLWIGTTHGLLRAPMDEFDKVATGRSRHLEGLLFDQSDGVNGIPNRLGYPTSARTTDGRLWFTTTGGIATANPRVNVQSIPPPSIAIDGLLVDENQIAPKQHSRLPAGTSRIQIDYTTPTFMAPSKVRFRYALDGFDRDWVYVGSRRQAVYTNLSPGAYRFRVAASGGGGKWTEADNGWFFSIQPRFYETSWFYAMSALTFVLVSWMTWRFQLRQVRRGYAMVFAERARIGREIHDTMLQGMVGLDMQLHAMSQVAEITPESTKGRLERARKQLEQYIREARQSIWDLRSPAFEQRDLWTGLREAGENIVAGQGMRFDCVVRGTPRAGNLRLEEYCLRIGQEALSNAARHSKATHVRVELAYEDAVIRLRVSDDGCGFDSSAVQSDANAAWGLRSMMDRAQQVGGKLHVTSRANKGTEVEFSAPFVHR